MKTIKPIELILASSSPRRKQLLGYLNIPFQVLPSHVEELSDAVLPENYVLEISHLKADYVFQKKTASSSSPFFVVAADTTVFFAGKFFGKPSSIEEAESYLYELSGQTHSVYTGVVALYYSETKKHRLSFYEKTNVTFNKIDSHLMKKYLRTGESLDKAGAYGIQGASLSFISKIEGDYANVVGFPLSRFYQECEKFFSPYVMENTSWLNLF